MAIVGEVTEDTLREKTIGINRAGDVSIPKAQSGGVSAYLLDFNQGLVWYPKSAKLVCVDFPDQPMHAPMVGDPASMERQQAYLERRFSLTVPGAGPTTAQLVVDSYAKTYGVKRDENEKLQRSNDMIKVYRCALWEGTRVGRPPARKDIFKGIENKKREEREQQQRSEELKWIREILSTR